MISMIGVKLAVVWHRCLIAKTNYLDSCLKTATILG
ncbi:hypothetical protein PS907_01679 [Pseudomonas fluorescens]|nr:hypothetical protein PS907_01679 [Pseudomonas fluorescens]